MTQAGGREPWARRLKVKQKQGAPTRTHPAKIHIRQRYVQQGVPQRELPVFRCLHDGSVPPAIVRVFITMEEGSVLCGRTGMRFHGVFCIKKLNFYGLYDKYEFWMDEPFAIQNVLSGSGYRFVAAVFLMDFASEMLLFLFKTRKNSSLCP